MKKSGSKAKPTPRCNDSTIQRFNALSIEICILTGGLSKRMGRDKSRLRLGPITMLGHIQKAARETGLPVRVIRRDCVPKCGPLGGIYTALKTTKAHAILFVACDMPLVSTELMQLILGQAGAQAPLPGTESRLQPASSAPIQNDQPVDSKTCSLCAIFTRSRTCAGFPFLLPCAAIEIVSQQIKIGDFSVRRLAKALKATILTLKSPWSRQLFNVNTPSDWAVITRRLETRYQARAPRGWTCI